ncbi:MAG: HAMP domain-containing sensor histidine kinase [Actinomycetota bacterium]
MQARLLLFVLPLVALCCLVGGVAAGAESARRISAEAQVERMAVVDEIVASIEAGAEPETVAERFGEEGRSVLIDPDELPQAEPDDLVVQPWHDGVFVDVTEVDGLEVVVVSDVDAVRAAVLRRWTIIGAVMLTVLAVAAAATYWLDRWVTRPVRRLDDAAERLAAGAVDVDVRIGTGAPELQRVAGHFDTIAGTLGQAVHRERIFVANAAHHLGNLTTPLRLRVESLDHSDPLVDEALTEVIRLEGVVEKLLALNRAEEHDLDPAVIDLADVVDECLGTWRPAAHALGVDLRTEVPANAYACAPPGALDEVVDNLLDNAVKYGDGSPIEVRVLRGLDHVRLVVTDGGPGMSDEELALAQARFWRAPRHQNQPGSGLGLSIVDAIAQRCDGHLELRTPPPGGFEAMLVLPRVAPV